MPAPALAAIPILVSFAEAAGIVVAGVATAAGIDTLSKKVEEYVEENPEQSQKILAMIMPAQGIANILKNESDDGEEVSETEVEIAVEEKPKLTGKEKGMRMRQAALQKKGNYSSPDAEGNYESKRGRMIRTAEELGLADPDLKDNYKKSNFDYKKYFRKADGGIMGSDKTYHQVRDQFMPMDSESMEYANGGGVGSMMQRKNFRYGGDTMGGKNDKSKTSKGPDRSAVGPGSTYANNVANQNDGGGGITNTINNINKPTVFDKVKNTVNKVVDSPLTAFIDPRSKLALAMGGYKYLRDGVTPFQQQSIDEELENIKTKGGIVPYADGGRVNYNQGSNWWDTLDPQGMNVYNSMKRGGHDDATIQGQLSMLGYYDPNAAPPDSTPDTPVVQQLGYQGGNDSPYAGKVVDQTDYGFNKKNYAPGEKLEINPAVFGMSFPDQPSGPKREGIINQAIDSFTSLPTRSLSSFVSPTTGGNIVGPAEQGFMGQTLDIDPAGRTREDIRSQYDNYNRFTGRTSNYEDARQKGKAGQVIGTLVGAAAGVPFLGTAMNYLSAMGGGDKSLQGKYTVDNAGFGNTGARDEFGLATFNKKDGFLGLKGNTTRDYSDRMNERLEELDKFFEEKFDKKGFGKFDINNLTPDMLTNMKRINGFYTKQIQAYKDRTEVENLNRQQKDKEQAEEIAKQQQEAAFQTQLNETQRQQRMQDLQRIERAYREDTGRGAGSYGPGGGSGQQSDGSYNDPFDPGGGE